MSTPTKSSRATSARALEALYATGHWLLSQSASPKRLSCFAP